MTAHRDKRDKNGISPTIVHLNDLPEEGREYVYNQDSGELTSSISDLIGDNPYKIHIHIRPVGNAFELKGQLETQLDLACSRCALEFKYSVKTPLSELLLVVDELPRTGRQAQVNHVTELDSSAPDYVTLPSDSFDVADFVHEIIAISEPSQPLGKPDCDDNCENLLELYRQGWLQPPGDQKPEPTTNSPFAGLKDIKLNS